MSWSSRLAGFSLLAALAGLIPAAAFASDQDLWNEYGLVHTDTGKLGKLTYTAYRFRDLTGALAAWEWQRSPEGKACDQAPYCTEDGQRTVVFDNNYLVEFHNPDPPKAAVDTVLAGLPDKTDTAMPAILTFLPRQGLVPDSARYVLGKDSLEAFAPELARVDAGFSQGAEAQVALYKLNDTEQPVRLAIFYYPTPEMARLHLAQFRQISGAYVKRSDVLLAIVYGGASAQQADTLLSRVQYEAKITWNDIPPPPPLKPLYRLLLNIIYASIGLSLLGLTAGLIYAGTRLYRRKYGQLDAEEAMTTLHLTAD